MERRVFLTMAATASAAAATGDVMATAAQRRRQGANAAATQVRSPQERNLFTRPPAVEPITGFLKTFKPVTGAALDPSHWKFEYDSVLWRGASAVSRNSSDGTLRIQRRAQGKLAQYTVEQERLVGGLLRRLRAEAVCRAEDGVLREWQVTTTFADAKTDDERAALSAAVRGRVTGQVLHLNRGGEGSSCPLTRPLLSSWSLWGALSAGKFRSDPFAFDLLDDLVTLLPDQRVWYTGQVEVSTAAGAVALHCYAHTGQGVLPRHYLVDDAGRVQLITASMLNWALRSVS